MLPSSGKKRERKENLSAGHLFELGSNDDHASQDAEQIGSLSSPILLPEDGSRIQLSKCCNFII
jgi:hypothetical protein